jgi:DNA-binding PadR family transcriptional regulator
MNSVRGEEVLQITDHEINLLESWETNYKRGLLTFWILFLLTERPGYAYEMSLDIFRISQETMSVNEQSIYRALTRFERMGLVTSENRPSEIGPPRKYYDLSPLGRRLLARFIKRNLEVFQQPEMVELFTNITADFLSEE